ncbi:MAG: thioredoxin domain-containing protein [Euryarchaeota archaeon]|nr:thioredoxin domain-containing protein [Euryarchaeota archaeon]
MEAWTNCPQCGASLRGSRLEGHVRRVHPGGATTEAERLKIVQRRRGVKKLGLAALVVLAIAGAILLASILPRLGQREPSGLSAEGEPAWGTANATLDVFLFADYQCPFCQRFELEGGLDHILQRWVTTGEVRLVFKDLAFIDEDSFTAAEASQAVWALAPGNWTEWNRLVYERQGPERSGWASHANLVSLAREWGKVPLAEFTESLDDGRHRAEVDGDVAEARRAGVTSTPSIVVGTRRLNALDRSAVDAAIGEALREAGASG